jgi:hypothetical protein
LIVLGFKPVENRSRRTQYRGDVGIVASVHLDVSDTARRFADRCNIDIYKQPRGAVIGVAELHDVVEQMDSDWFFGPFGYLYRGAQRLRTTIPIKGKLGVYQCDEELERQIRASV